jgi:hypothetical protein
MTRNTILICVALILAQASGGAQTLQDALRYSFLQYGGSARSMGTANSLGALGADFATLSTNPAGIAAYRRSEFMFTPSVASFGTESEFENSLFTTKKNAFLLNNIGVVFASAHRPNRRWKTFNVGIGTNRLANFNQRFQFEGLTQRSIADEFLYYAQGYAVEDLDEYLEYLAYETDLIYQPDATNMPTYYENDILDGNQTQKTQNVNIKGGITELAISMGANLEDKLYLGATIGLDFLNYSEQRSYTETDVDGSVPFFNRLDFDQNVSTTGWGINLKAGMIYRASQALRLGLAFHTPTAFALNDNYSNSMEYNITYASGTTQNNAADSPQGNFSYNLNTPWKAIADVGIIVGKQGFVSAEAEWVDYSGANFNFDEETSSADDLSYQNELNNSIGNELKGTLNFRLGGELAFDKYRARAGYSLWGNPYVVDSYKPKSSLHLGLGIREENFYIDAAYTLGLGEETYIPYRLPDNYAQYQPVVNNKLKGGQFALTVGVKFGN